MEPYPGARIAILGLLAVLMLVLLAASIALVRRYGLGLQRGRRTPLLRSRSRCWEREELGAEVALEMPLAKTADVHG